MIVGTGGAEIYDYTLDIAKAQFPLDGSFKISINPAVLETLGSIYS